MRLAVCIMLISLCIAQAEAQVGGPGFASVKNMIEDVVPKVVSSIINADPQIKTIAIWHLDAAVNQQIDMTLLEERLTSGLVAANQFKRFVVIDRPGLQLLAEEKGLELVNVVDRKLMRQVGQALDIDGFLYGSVNLQSDSLILALRLLDPRRAAIVWGETFEAKDPVLEAKRRQAIEEAERSLKAQKLIKNRKSEASAALRSMLLPGLGQFYTSQSSEGISFLFVDGVAVSLVFLSYLSENSGGTDLVTVGVALLVANRLVSTIHAAISANRYNVNLEQSLGEGAELSWNPRTSQLRFGYTHRF